MTLTKYIIGFVASLALTLIAYNLVVGEIATGLTLMLLLGGLALLQMIVQLVYFLHLDVESSPRYKLASFLFMGGILFIVVAGSIWIMNNLNYNMMQMTPEEKSQYMMTQHDKGF